MKNNTQNKMRTPKVADADRSCESLSPVDNLPAQAALEVSQEALQWSERLRAQAEKMGKVGGWEFDIDTQKQIWTEMVYRIHEVDLSYQPTVAKGINFYTPESRPVIQRAVQRALELGEPFDDEMEIITAKGNRRNVHAIGGADLSRRKVFGFFQDITERKQMERRIKLFSQEIISAREEERRQVASVLHHDVGSLAVGISANLDAIEEDIRAGKHGEALKRVKKVRKLFADAVGGLKSVAAQLRPPELDAIGLRAALRQLISQITEKRGTQVHFAETLGRRRVCGDTATILFRIAQEALTNAIKHGHAKRVDVDLGAAGKEVTLTVRDSGKGFDPSRLKRRATSQMGLRVMQEMAASVGGACRVESARGEGATVRACLPFPPSALALGSHMKQGKQPRTATRGSRLRKAGEA